MEREQGAGGGGPTPLALRRAAEMTCLCCLDEISTADESGRTCGFCEKGICGTCLPHLIEINDEGEGDEENGDLRCPHCRRSYIEGDLHKRRKVIRSHAPDMAAQSVEDIVTLEDVLARVMQLCAHSETGVSYFSVEPAVVAQAISRDATYTAMLERVMGSARRARQLRLSIVRSQPDKAHIRILCKEYMSQLTKVAGRSAHEAQCILGAHEHPRNHGTRARVLA